MLSAGAVITVEDGGEVGVGDVIARMPQESSKTRDITGGLPRVADLFEARKPKEPAMLAEISGTVSFGKETKGKQRLIITDADGEQTETLVPKWRRVEVFEGEHVEKGETVVDGCREPARHPAPAGRERAGQLHRQRGAGGLPPAGREDQRQAHRGHRAPDAAQGRDHAIRATPRFLRGEQVDRARVLEENERVRGRRSEPATWQPVLLGITKASLATESFISAASFQETTRVLTEASVNGKMDELRGLKENVIVGRLIPAGTGFAYHEERRRKPAPGSGRV